MKKRVQNQHSHNIIVIRLIQISKYNVVLYSTSATYARYMEIVQIVHITLCGFIVKLNVLINGFVLFPRSTLPMQHDL